ncbi:MAG: hypothetical protein L6R19_11810 [Alphaproteobacteria bacterium]|nr:hypothetical protein [Alphaproteobacteria bacterium]
MPRSRNTDVAAAPKLQLKLASRSPGKRMTTCAISSTSRERRSRPNVASAWTPSGSASKTCRAALMQ